MNPIVKPFKGIFYDKNMVEWQDVLAPAYHSLTPAQWDLYRKKDEKNISHLITGSESGWYAKSATLWERWKSQRDVDMDAKPAFYVLHQSMKTNGKTLVRKGCIGLLRLPSEGENHYSTLFDVNVQQRDDRMRLLEATKTHFDQITCFYNSPSAALDSLLTLSVHAEPFLEYVLDGVKTQLWRVTNQTMIDHALHFFSQEKFFIAEGSHRLAAAIHLRDSMREQARAQGVESSDSPADYIPAFFCSVSEPASMIFPIHRVIDVEKEISREEIIAQLHKNFTLNQYSREQGLQKFRMAGKHAFLFALPGTPTCTLARLKNEELLPGLFEQTESELKQSLDLTILHDHILKEVLKISSEDQRYSDRITYVSDESEVFSCIQKRNAIGILHNAPSLPQLIEASAQSVSLPFQSFQFLPQLPSGMVMYSLDSP